MEAIYLQYNIYSNICGVAQFTSSRYMLVRREFETNQRLSFFLWSRNLSALLSTYWFQEQIWAWFI